MSLVGFHLVEEIGQGHKHICILKFENEIPKIFNKIKDISNHFKDQDFKSAKMLCMCQKVDFEAIKYYLKIKFIENTEG